MTAENDKFPEWAREEREHDFEWIGDNLHIFWPAATDAYVHTGRGTIIVDTTQQPEEGLGHPFGYFAQKFCRRQTARHSAATGYAKSPSLEWNIEQPTHENKNRDIRHSTLYCPFDIGALDARVYTSPS